MEVKLSEKIYSEVRMRILSGNIGARDFISEAQIAKEYGVSKAPVKEALHILADQGYLISYPRRGYMVNLLTNEEINRIQEVRRCLEKECVRLAISRATDAEIESLRVYGNQESHSPDPRDTINTKFHIRLAELSGNPVMVDTLKPLIIKASIGNIQGDPDTASYEGIIEALLERNEALALTRIESDIRNI